MCGKMAAGKSTLAKSLAARERAILLVQDDWLARLYGDEVTDLAAFVRYSTRIQSVVAPLVCQLLAHGHNVVLDFPANTRKQRVWFRSLLDHSGGAHRLHYVVASDALCKRQLAQRSAALGLPPGSKWTTEADFDEVTAYFEPPASDEGFEVVRYERDG